jgi:hypothetical protein
MDVEMLRRRRGWIKQDLRRGECSRLQVPNQKRFKLGTVGVWCFSLNLIADRLDRFPVAPSDTVGNLAPPGRYPLDLLRRHL